MKLSKYIDHTLLKATAQHKDILKLCEEAIQYDFYAVCIHGSYVKLAKEQLVNSEVKVAAVIGFPLGAMSTETKVFEAKDCISKGASEIDMVINIGKLLDEEFEYVENEIREIKKAIGSSILKIIFDTCYLTKKQIEIASQLAMNTGADYIKTSTGFGFRGATFEDVIAMKGVVGNKVKIKASGGIKDKKIAEKYIKLGVSRLGTSSGILLVSNKSSKK